MSMNDIISESKLERALVYLAETDDQYAKERAELERAEILRKRIRARVFLASDGTVAERQAMAEVHPDSEKADDIYVATIAAVETLKARRQRADIIIEVWRSLNANRRKT